MTNVTFFPMVLLSRGKPWLVSNGVIVVYKALVFDEHVVNKCFVAYAR